MIQPEKVDAGPFAVVGWLSDFTDERPMFPRNAALSDVWVVMEKDFGEGVTLDDVYALACVDPESEPVELLRIGVQPDYRREGHATRLVDALYEEYGPLTLEVRESNDGARAFYEATGWVEGETNWADPEDLVTYEYDPD